MTDSMVSTSLKGVLVPPPARQRKPKAIRSNDPAMPYIGVYIEALHKWFVDRDLNDVVSLFCCERDGGNDGFGYGASEIGGSFPIYIMSTGVQNKRQIGTMSYNGNVKLTEALA